MSPRVSVIMAVRNGWRHLEESVSSVLRQRVTDFEFIVVDDGSTDETAQILERFREQDSRMVIVHQGPQGQTSALNRAAGMARGEYLARQDADDVSLPDRFGCQVRFLDRHPSIAAVGTAAEAIDAEGRIIGRVPTFQGPDAVRRGLLRVRASLVHGSVMMRREAFEVAGGYREAFRFCQDFDLWLRLAQHVALDNLPEVLFRWRITPGGVYATQRMAQLQYGGIGLAFALERRRRGTDSYPLLEEAGVDLDTFAERYHLRRRLYAIWGELLLRGLNDPAAARPYLQRAIRHGDVRPKTLCYFGLALSGRRWLGKPPIQAHPLSGAS